MYPDPTKDASVTMDAGGNLVVRVRCNDCARSGGGEHAVPTYERQSPRVPEIEGLYLETRKSGGPFHACAKHRPPKVLLNWSRIVNRPPPVRQGP